MYRKIIVPVDIGNLERGESILRKAGTLLDEGGEIVLLNVVEDIPGYIAIDLPPDMMDNAMKDSRQKLEDLRARAGVKGAIEVRSGAAAHEIIAAAQEHAADLVIVASHKPDFSNYFIGATADRVVRHAKCSVLVDR
ncbi:universal stress protein [Rhizobiaceae bacterium n13]|uniref:Universal stress protein n=1 Tax=Ferirhizobium litorale TaxID=2927786 RepID=A0AAE3U2W2_9HYPH|nr:universal stress protein [Fererhizobium litorale]MDI7861302.1 universal stress protein [Fererhizobium litorale]MDI7921449.1 universal stress protein [Fererhizobium litorale]